MPEPISLSAILSAPGVAFQLTELANKIGQLLGMIDTISGKLDKLMQTPLNAGMRMLDAASNSEIRADQVDQLQHARVEFQKAVGLEKSYRLALALLGVACCHSWLGSGQRNVDSALHQILEIDGSPPIGEVVQAHNKKDSNWDMLGAAIGTGAVLFVFTEVFPIPGVIAATVALFLGGGPGMFLAKFLRLGIKKAVEDPKDWHTDILPLVLAAGGDSSKLVRIQMIVAEHLNRPIPWLADLSLKPARA